MDWKTILREKIEQSYNITEALLNEVNDSELNWKPATGRNWMTTGQLLMHIASSCGKSFQGFITGDWVFPKPADMKKRSMEEMLPAAEKMPTLTRVAEAQKLLAADRKLALELLETVSETDLENKPAPAAWDPTEMPLGLRLLSMVDHLVQHKGQLFYYLKLQGKSLHTGHLWGMK